MGYFSQLNPTFYQKNVNLQNKHKPFTRTASRSMVAREGYML